MNIPPPRIQTCKHCGSLNSIGTENCTACDRPMGDPPRQVNIFSFDNILPIIFTGIIGFAGILIAPVATAVIIFILVMAFFSTGHSLQTKTKDSRYDIEKKSNPSDLLANILFAILCVIVGLPILLFICLSVYCAVREGKW